MLYLGFKPVHAGLWALTISLSFLALSLSIYFNTECYFFLTKFINIFFLSLSLSLSLSYLTRNIISFFLTTLFNHFFSFWLYLSYSRWNVISFSLSYNILSSFSLLLPPLSFFYFIISLALLTFSFL